jgi:pimeloyl-ACP methyl ester carboxylesterase
MTRFTTNDGIGLHYTDAGSGRPVVLVHGYAAPAVAWALTEDALVAAGYRVIRDWRGFNALDAGRARRAGLLTRPLQQTLTDTLAWELTREPRSRRAGPSEEDERALLEELMTS